MTAAALQHEIHMARPSLRLISPLPWWIVLILGVFNILLGVSFLFAIDQDRFSAPLLIVNTALTFDFWGVIFIGIGTLKIFSLYMNQWELSRKSLFIGVVIKVAWMITLIIRSIISPGTWFLTLMWVALASIQMAAYILFMPPNIRSSAKDEGNKYAK